MAAMVPADLSGTAIAKRLASCNKSARHRAVRLLSTWLADQPTDAVSDDVLIKIWKGLFYCIWHSDKLPAQLELINRLAGLIPSLPIPLASRYLVAFLSTIRREWSGIDFLRLDKFYLLIRRFMRHLFILMSNSSWDSELTSSLMVIISENSFLASDKFPAQGVNYHIAEIFLDELIGFLPVSPTTFEVLLKPFHSVLEKSRDKVLVNKIKVNVFDRLLRNGIKLLDLESSGEKAESGSEVEKIGKLALGMVLSNKLFDSASATETPQGNRKVLFGLHDGFLKLEKDLEKSGVNVTMELVTSQSNEQSEIGVGCEGLEDQQSKKKKRKKLKEASEKVEKESKTKKKKSKTTTLDLDMESDATIPNGSTDTVVSVGNGEAANGDVTDAYSMIAFDEPVISNLQKQFEKVAAEAGMKSNSSSGSDLSETPKKRKRKSGNRQATISPGSVNGGSVAGKSVEKSAKKVSFSMKSNLVWKPQTPLPPQSLRLPPSATPRGSALKKGISPGPIRETPSSGKKVKVKSSSGKKGRKNTKAVSQAVKRLRKLQNRSA